MRSYRSVLEAIQLGELSVDEGLRELSQSAVEDIGFAQIDHDRTARRGFAEVVYCEGKTPEQSALIMARLAARGESNVLGTRATREVFELLKKEVPDAEYDDVARAVVVRRGEQASLGSVLVVAAGTSDLRVAEEAALTASLMGSHVERLYDVGVAGLHRLLRQLDRLRTARVLVVVAGMEGALLSVVAGLVDKPVIGVPTSVGYGAQLQGLTPMLGMLTSCVPGSSVVNIDNGFGAGYLANMINRLGEA
ncbi:nickel pincer cofactor biosynthesis protein LarB [Alicyclobacillus acidoterrestris]|uniref:Nickel pincer cofactor biosynthesis protein LarB n=1 Tax=Alicyclobacillus acidoterrestris (strain ATCC 49025 / DSM 3922 / CIP 106132 / NCIMB 13137 / GD3B) TaxID=1356854 RepID=T0BN22_ALIAG|nr:nickel pincer cofactor biosynthesis protein LarB [Alicyclobacillus acidoterrestris]EPZ42154.1 1-(5-phosphoribosyl)-5-amino-4-imidazole-carboxylate carboxylase [Alicyclobacillus acidoterrestris ATCC 49025]UNO50660.1 nickel pincer cofactor biosynthesis protein LarB [Alicyclobacillus acidoterrestris]